jgi:hypothetical protein
MLQLPSKLDVSGLQLELDVQLLELSGHYGLQARCGDSRERMHDWELSREASVSPPLHHWEDSS